MRYWFSDYVSYVSSALRVPQHGGMRSQEAQLFSSLLRYGRQGLYRKKASDRASPSTQSRMGRVPRSKVYTIYEVPGVTIA